MNSGSPNPSLGSPIRDTSPLSIPPAPSVLRQSFRSSDPPKPGMFDTFWQLARCPELIGII
ncbi:hypothetical protein BDW62DRAFT_191329 [Aspergillus aurantiobrunneus]